MKYREVNVPPFLSSAFAERDSHDNQLESQMVKGTSEIVDHISSDSGNIGFINVKWPEFKAWLRGIGIVLEADRLKGCFAQRKDSRLQLIEVLLGPFNFYADQRDSVVGGH